MDDALILGLGRQEGCMIRQILSGCSASIDAKVRDTPLVTRNGALFAGFGRDQAPLRSRRGATGRRSS
jgi:hypothetical protein